MRTTLTIDDDVAAALERIRRLRNISFKELVNETLRKGLQEASEPTPKNEMFRTQTFSVGRCLLPNLDNVAEVLAIAEGEDYR